MQRPAPAILIRKVRSPSHESRLITGLRASISRNY